MTSIIASSAPTSPDSRDLESERHQIDAIWLIRLRWSAIAGQVVTIALVRWGLDVELPLGWLGVIVAVEVAFNLLCVWLRGRDAQVSARGLASFMAVDVLTFTALLHLTGGPLNPFNFLYLVHIAVAAVVLPARWTWALIALSALCFGGLFLGNSPFDAHAHHHDAHHETMNLHLVGMWVAFFVAAIYIVSSTTRVMRALQRREVELGDAREQALRAEKFASLATLATGAAHELATPLSTIALVARELELELERLGDRDLSEDARLIRAEVRRCRDILEQLASDAGQTIGDVASAVPLGDLITEAVEPFIGPSLRLQIPDDLRAVEVRVPARTFAHALRSVVKNALEASPDGAASVEVDVGIAGGLLTIEVVDHGVGMAPEVLSRATEPFFSTRAPGEGMGLGLFVSRSVADALGGRFLLDSRPGQGTRATFELPLNTPPGVTHE